MIIMSGVILMAFLYAHKYAYKYVFKEILICSVIAGLIFLQPRALTISL